MSTVVHAHWLDGRHLASRPVTVAREGATLRLEGLDAPTAIPLAQVHASNRLARVPRFFYLPGGASLEIADNDAADILLTARKRDRLNVLIDWLERRSRVAAAAAVLLIASVIGLVYFGLPVAARRAAHAVPADIERKAGEAALATLSNMLADSQLNRKDRARVTAQAERIARARALPASPRLEFRTMGQFPNAFALPGGILVVSDELVRLATDEELAAVLAHEIAHWQLRHGAQIVFRGSAALLVVSTVTGDLSTLTGFTAGLPVLLLQRGYSREFEQEADDYAVATLQRAGIDSRHLAAILTKLERARPGTSADFSYLSTHPSTEGRTRKIDPTNTYLRLIPEPSGQTIGPPAEGAESSASPAESSGVTVRELVARHRVPTLVERRAPEFPAALLAARASGRVVVEFQVENTGRVRRARAKSSTNTGFDRAAVEAVRRWKFTAAPESDPRLVTTFEVAVDFRITSAATEPPAGEATIHFDPPPTARH